MHKNLTRTTDNGGSLADNDDSLADNDYSLADNDDSLADKYDSLDDNDDILEESVGGWVLLSSYPLILEEDKPGMTAPFLIRPRRGDFFGI